jgi:glucose/arabinose dehydrogenase
MTPSLLLRGRQALCLTVFCLGSRLGANPAAFGYAIGPAFGGISFLAPTQVVFAPGETNRAFVVEQGGRIAMVADLSHPTRQVIVDLSASLAPDDSGHGMLSMAFHPQFAQNGFFYVWTPIWESGSRFLRLLRFTLSASGTVDPASQLTLLSQPVGAGGHDGGTLLFGADGYLYLSIGDGDEGAAGAEAIASHQRIDLGFFGGVFRLDVDKRPGNLTPNAHLGVISTGYLVPADNPFVGATSFNGSAVDPAQVRTEFWAVGLRNPFRMAFDSATNALWVGDVGLNLEEEIDVITPGANYGWNFREGTVPGPAAASTPPGVTFVPPVWQYSHALGDCCVTGGTVYHGTKFPELEGDYLFADYGSGRVWAALTPAIRPFAASQVVAIAAAVGITDLTLQPGTGDILFANINAGQIQRIIGAAASAAAGPPVATAQPGTPTVIAGGTAVFSFGVSGAQPMSYQWLFNGGPIAGATSSFLVLRGSGPAAAGIYTCVATNAAGSLTSALGTLTFAATGTDGRLVNISTRAPVGSGNNAMTAGFIVGGSLSKTFLIRAAGPALAPFGVTGLLPDPQLSLFSGQTAMASNQGWGGDPQVAAVAASVGAFSWGSAGTPDSALVVTLPPGAYTAQVTGAAGDGGVALVEVYEVP